MGQPIPDPLLAELLILVAGALVLISVLARMLVLAARERST